MTADQEIYNNIQSSFEKLGQDIQHISRRIDIIEGTKFIEKSKQDIPTPPQVTEPRYNIGGTGSLPKVVDTSQGQESVNKIIEQKNNQLRETLVQVLEQFQKVMNQKIELIEDNIENITVQIVKNEKDIKQAVKDIKELEEFLVGESKTRERDADRKDGYVNIDNLPSTATDDDEEEQ